MAKQPSNRYLFLGSKSAGSVSANLVFTEKFGKIMISCEGFNYFCMQDFVLRSYGFLRDAVGGIPSYRKMHNE